MRTGSSLREEIVKNVRIVGANENLKTQFVGDDLEASNDGNCIRLPVLPNNAELKLNDVLYFRGLADHEALHSLHTPFTEWKKIGQYCIDSGDPRCISMKVLNAAEDVRIERLGIQSHPGIKDNLQVVVDRLIEYQNNDVNPDDHPIFALGGVITWEGRQANGIHIDLPKQLTHKRDQLAVWDFKPLYSSDNFQDQLMAVAKFMSTNMDIHTLTNYLNNVPADKAKEQNEASKTGEAGKNECQINGGQIDTKGEFLPSDGRTAVDTFDMVSFPYFVPDDSIKYADPKQDDFKLEIPAHFEAYGNQFLRALKSYQEKLNESSRRSGQLDHRKLVSAYRLQDKIWQRKSGNTRGYDTAVGLLLDHSSSMCDDIYSVMQLSASLAVALRSVNIPFELTGFAADGPIRSVVASYHTRNLALRIIGYKSFNEGLDFNKLNSCRFYCTGYTPDSEALELAVNRISKRPERRKILVILTDGESACGYSSIQVQNKTIKTRSIFDNHKAAVLEYAKELGVEVYSIGVGNNQRMAIYDQDNILKVDSVDDLNQGMFEVFLNAIHKGSAGFKR